MRQMNASLPALALGVAAAMALVSCGGGNDADLLPGATANEITANLDMVRELADNGDCEGAQDAALQVSDQIEALGGIDKRLKQVLRDGAAQLNEVVANCVEATTEAIAPASIPEMTETTKPPKEKEKKPKKDKKDEAPTPRVDHPPTNGPPTDAPPTEVPPAPPGGGTGEPGGVAPGAPVGEDDG